MAGRDRVLGVPAVLVLVVALVFLVAALTVPAARAGTPDQLAGTALRTGRDDVCSAGFAVRSPRGTPRLLTAGHCTRTGGEVRAVDATGADRGTVGLVRSSHDAREGDWGVIDLAGGGVTTPVTPSAAPGPLSGVGTLAVGTPVCRYGAVTGRQCGVVTAVGVTANYGTGPVGGLVAVSACSEPGDSGGPVVSETAGGTLAVGLLSGGAGTCASGGTSLVQPLGPVLAAEGLELVTG